jgi:hypothetical protein
MATEGVIELRWCAAWLLLAPSACAPNVILGADAPLPDAAGLVDAVVVAPDANDEVDAGDATDADDGGLIPVPFPWSTGFENGYADYDAGQGYCYEKGGGAYAIVTPPSPVHMGTHSIAFTVTTGGGATESETRCVLQGVLPQTAYYGAWYYVPSAVINAGLWNLIHFQGASGPAEEASGHGLWDVSLVNDSTGALHVSAYDFLHTETPDASGVPPIPIGAWFHLEVFLQRASDATGRFTLYQDDVVAFDLSGIETDDTPWGQFYVGNLATTLGPPQVTVYVDDISIGSSL